MKNIVSSPDAEMWINSKKLLDFCIGMSSLSAPCDPIVLKKQNSEMKIHSQIHVHIIKPTGTGKSTIAKNIPGAEVIHGYTPASIMGSITKTGDFVPSFLIPFAKKTIIFDEFNKLHPSCYQAILSLLEDQYYVKTLGYLIKGNIDSSKLGVMKKDGWQCIPFESMNGFRTYVRFSVITFSSNLSKLMKEELLSRGICFKLESTFDETIDEFCGDYSMDIKNIPKLKYLGEIILNNYEKVVQEIRGLMKQSKFWDWIDMHSGYGTRICSFMFRIAAMYARIQGRNEILRTDLESAYKLLPEIIFNQRKVALTSQQHQILGAIHKLKKDGEKITGGVIARMVNAEPTNVWAAIRWLKLYGFDVGDCNEE